MASSALVDLVDWKLLVCGTIRAQPNTVLLIASPMEHLEAIFTNQPLARRHMPHRMESAILLGCLTTWIAHHKGARTASAGILLHKPPPLDPAVLQVRIHLSVVLNFLRTDVEEVVVDVVMDVVVDVDVDVVDDVVVDVVVDVDVAVVDDVVVDVVVDVAAAVLAAAFVVVAAAAVL